MAAIGAGGTVVGAGVMVVGIAVATGAVMMTPSGLSYGMVAGGRELWRILSGCKM